MVTVKENMLNVNIYSQSGLDNDENLELREMKLRFGSCSRPLWLGRWLMHRFTSSSPPRCRKDLAQDGL